MKSISPSELPAGIERVSETENSAIARLLATREIRQSLAAVLPDVLAVVAGDKKIKKFILKMVGRYLEKSLSRPDDVLENPELQYLFKDGHFIRDITGPLPELVNGLFDLVNTAAQTIEQMETGEKKELFGDLAARLATGQTGTLITRGCRILNDIHKDDPEFFARTLAPGFKNWIETIDFGELKEMVDHSAKDASALVKMANQVMWQYPAKVVLLLSLIPSVVNMATDALDISLEKLNEMPPDLLTDVILSFIREIDARPAAGLFNQLTELARKIHTGSALLGEPGVPKMPQLLSAKIDEIAQNVDPITLWKAKMALAETGASIDRAMAEAVNSRPAYKQLSLIKGPEITNIRVKTVNRRLSFWEALDDAEAAGSVSRSLNAYDVQEAAEVVNQTLRLFNRVGDAQPESISGFIGQFLSAIDDYELAEASRKIFSQAQPSPAARAVVPGLVNWIVQVLKPADDEYEDDAQAARQSLGELFNQQEV